MALQVFHADWCPACRSFLSSKAMRDLKSRVDVEFVNCTQGVPPQHSEVAIKYYPTIHFEGRTYPSGRPRDAESIMAWKQGEAPAEPRSRLSAGYMQELKQRIQQKEAADGHLDTASRSLFDEILAMVDVVPDEPPPPAQNPA